MRFDPMMQSIAIPLAAGLLCLVLPRRWAQGPAGLAIAGVALTLPAVGVIFAGLAGAPGPWLRSDALSGFILLATAGFGLLLAVYSREYLRGQGGQRIYFGCLLGTLAMANGVLLANDFVVLLVCWGLLAVTLYLMIGLAGPDAAGAARKAFLIVGGSDALLLLGAALMWGVTGSTRMDQGPLALDSAPAGIAFLCILAAALAKAGAIPLHGWVPDCGEKALAPVTAFLPAALDKLLGIYLLARAVMDLFVMTSAWNTLLMCLGALTVMGAVMMALVQHDLKRLLAFHAVSQVGYMVLGIGTGTLVGLAGGLFHMLNHAIYKCCLFLGAGVVEQEAGTVDLDRLGGLATRLPFTFAAFLVASLSISGVPPFNGFASKWMVYQGIVESGRGAPGMLWVVWLAAAVLGSALTLASFVKVLHAVFLCKPAPAIRSRTIREAGWPMVVPMLVLAGLCVLFGVFVHSLPLAGLILPAIREPVAFTGSWWAGTAAGLLALTFLLGWAGYGFAFRHGRVRICPTYVGGEDLAAVGIPGEPAGDDRHVEVTGVDFYRTVQEMPGLRTLYAWAGRKRFDLYTLGGVVSGYLVGWLRGAHTGVLPRYLSWFVLGLLGVLYWMMKGGP